MFLKPLKNLATRVLSGLKTRGVNTRRKHYASCFYTPTKHCCSMFKHITLHGSLGSRIYTSKKGAFKGLNQAVLFDMAIFYGLSIIYIFHVGFLLMASQSYSQGGLL